jgi:hypothetical protein
MKNRDMQATHHKEALHLEDKNLVVYYRFMNPIEPPLALQEAIFNHICSQSPFKKLNLSYHEVSLLEDCYIKFELCRLQSGAPILSSELDKQAFCSFGFEIEDEDGATFRVELQKLIGDADARVLSLGLLRSQGK